HPNDNFGSLPDLGIVAVAHCLPQCGQRRLAGPLQCLARRLAPDDIIVPELLDEVGDAIGLYLVLGVPRQISGANRECQGYRCTAEHANTHSFLPQTDTTVGSLPGRRSRSDNIHLDRPAPTGTPWLRSCLAATTSKVNGRVGVCQAALAMRGFFAF